MEPIISQPTLEIEDTSLDWKDAIESHKADKVVRLYSEDAVMMSAFTPQIFTNYEARKNYFEEFLKLPGLTVNFLESHIRFIGEGAVNSGIYRFDYKSEAGKRSMVCRYTFVFRRKASTWLIETHHSSVLPQDTLHHFLDQ